MQVAPYILYSKNPRDLGTAWNSFSITNGTIDITPETHLVLRFRRRFDATFRPGVVQVLHLLHFPPDSLHIAKCLDLANIQGISTPSC